MRGLRCIYVSLFANNRNLWIMKSAMIKQIGPAKYPRETILDPRNTHEKNFWTYEIPTRKNVRPTKYQIFVLTKYPQEKISDPRNTHEGPIA